MPRAKSKSASGLSIEVKDHGPFYTPGSIVEGKVTLSAAEHIAIGEITIALYAREKVFFVQHHGQGESYWRGRAPLFSRSAVLYDGKHTHKPGSYSWPFELTIPTCPDELATREKKFSWKPREHFRSTGENAAEHSLPSTFNYRKWGFGYRFHAYIEYVLEVNHAEPQEASIVRASRRKTVMPLRVLGTAVTDRVTRPLPGIEFSLPPELPEKSQLSPIQSRSAQSLVSQTTTHTVKSFRLHQRYQEEKLSFRQKASSLFNSSDVPSFTFTAKVSRPDNIRLLSNSGIPFHVSFSPLSDKLQTTIHDQEYPDIRIEALTLTARAITFIRCRGLGITRHEHTSYDVQLLDRQPVGYNVVLNQEGRRIDNTALPSKDVSPARSEAEGRGIDLSRLPGLAVTLSAAKLGSNTESPLTPSFNGYVISREYELRWKLELDVVGQKIRVESEGDKQVAVSEAPVGQTAQFLTSGMTAAILAEDDEEDDSDSDEDDEGEDTSRLASRMSKLLSSGKKKSKEAEAAAEGSNAESERLEGDQSLPRYEDAAGDSTVSQEALPEYRS